MVAQVHIHLGLSVTHPVNHLECNHCNAYHVLCREKVSDKTPFEDTLLVLHSVTHRRLIEGGDRENWP